MDRRVGAVVYSSLLDTRGHVKGDVTVSRLGRALEVVSDGRGVHFVFH